MSEQDLENGFNALTVAAEKLWEVNNDLEAKLIADEEAELDTGEEAVLTEQQKAVLTKTANESAFKLKEIKHLVQDVLWSNFGANEVLTSLEFVESECNHTAAIDLSGKQEAYEFMLTHLQDLTKTARELHDRWKR